MIMGIVQKQTIINTIITYTGVAVGFVTSALIFPKVLGASQIGLLSILVSYSVIFAQFASFGFNVTTIKVFPVFRDKKKKHNGFLFISLAVALAGFLVAMAIFFLIKPALIENTAGRSPLLDKYILYLIPLILFTILFKALDSYYNSLFNAVIGLAAKEFIQRLLIFAMIILYFYEIINFPTFVLLYVTALCLPTIILAFGLIIQGEFSLKPSFSLIDKPLARHMISVSLFGTISGFAGITTFNIDKIMVERFLGLGQTGIYTTVFYFATLIVLPSRAMLRIISPVVSEAWNANNKAKLSEIYHKSALHLFIAGVLVFAGIWGNIDNIFRILPDLYAQGKWVILFIGLAYIFDMASGGAISILINSKQYRYQTYFMVLLIVLIVITNLTFIPWLGITGAAMASAISKFIVNTGRYAFLKKRFKLEPYNYRFLIVLAAGAVAYGLSLLIPLFDSLIMDILIRSLVILLVFTLIIVLSGISEDINKILKKIIKLPGTK